MSKNKPDFAASSLDPADDAPEWTDEMFEIAEVAVGGKVIRPAKAILDRKAWCADALPCAGKPSGR